MSIPHKITDPKELYKKEYQLFSQFRGSRYIVLRDLENCITMYQPYLAEVQLKGEYASSFDFEFNKIEQKTLVFLNTTFPQTVTERFRTLPKIKDKYVKGKTGYFNINKGKSYAKKIISHTNFLEYIRNCLEDYGLHDDIDNSFDLFSSRYFVSIIYNKEKKREISRLYSFKELNENFITAYLDREDIFIRGSRIAYDLIDNFRVASSSLKNDEIKLYKLKHGLKNEEEFFDKSPKATRFFLNTTKVNQNFTIGKEVWDMVHPKIREEVKPLIKSKKYDKAVLTAYISYLSIVKTDYKTKTGEELDGTKLVNKVFSPNSPIFQITEDLTTESGQNKQKGYMMIAAGAVSAFRNPAGHENRKISLEDALQEILIASYLLKKFEQRSKI